MTGRLTKLLAPLTAPALVLLTTGAVLAQSEPREYYHGPGMMWGGYGGGFGMFFGFFFMILILAAIAVGLLLLLRALGFMADGSSSRAGNSNKALDILKERFARGEIDAKEFAERKQHLSD